MNQRRIDLLRLLGVSLFLLFAVAAFAEAPTVRSTEPQLPPKTIELEESWRVGGEDGDMIFGMMVDSLEDADGNVYLLDAQLCQVEVFSADGEHLRTVSRQGDGPGELRLPQNMILLPDNTLAILQLFPAKFVNLTLDGTPCEGLTFGGVSSPQTGFSAAFQATCRGGTTLISAQKSTPSETGQLRNQYLSALSADGAEAVRFREADMTMDFSNPRFVEKDLLPAFLLSHTVDGQGRVLAVRDRNEYAIEVYNPDGSLLRVIEREFQNRNRDTDEVRRLNALVDAWTEGFPGEMIRDLETIEPSIVDMHVDDDGILWVQHSRSGRDQPEGVLLTYDTFSPDGAWLQEVSIRAEGNPVYDGLRFLGGDRVLFIKGYALARWASRGAQNVDFGEEEAEPMEIVYCRLIGQ
jgi:6-bladed beta-propeller